MNWLLLRTDYYIEIGMLFSLMGAVTGCYSEIEVMLLLIAQNLFEYFLNELIYLEVH